MAHRISNNDQVFCTDIESCRFPMSDFDHRAHLRLAYIYLCAAESDAYEAMRDAILINLSHLGIDPDTKYHSTITRAWILAVRHFMEITPDCDSADSFIQANPIMLDSKIMLTHYSADVLFSDQARASFVEPDRDPIPRY